MAAKPVLLYHGRHLHAGHGLLGLEQGAAGFLGDSAVDVLFYGVVCRSNRGDGCLGEENMIFYLSG